MKIHIEPHDLTSKILKQAQKDVLIFSNKEIWETPDTQRFYELLRNIIKRNL